MLHVQGDYQEARVNLISHMRLLQRGMATSKQQREYINFIRQAERLDGFMREAQQQEAMLATQQGRVTVEERKMARDDSAAKNIVQMKLVSCSAFVA
jgi:hypothetical protein